MDTGFLYTPHMRHASVYGSPRALHFASTTARTRTGDMWPRVIPAVNYKRSANFAVCRFKIAEYLRVCPRSVHPRTGRASWPTYRWRVGIRDEVERSNGSIASRTVLVPAMWRESGFVKNRPESGFRTTKIRVLNILQFKYSEIQFHDSSVKCKHVFNVVHV